VVVAPIYEVTGMNGVGPHVEEAGLGLIAGYLFSAPYEDVKLKGK
jgi:peptide/nickel transport system substrate-binding protein